MKSFNRYLIESKFNFDGNDFIIVPDNEKGVNISFGKFKKLTPYKKTVDGIKIFSLYNVKKNMDSTDILDKLKKSDFNSKSIKNFIVRTAIYANRVVEKLDIDLIVMPKSSSPMIKKLIEELQKRIHIDIFYDTFKKRTDMSKISIDKKHPKITPKIINSLEKNFNKSKKRRKFVFIKNSSSLQKIYY